MTWCHQKWAREDKYSVCRLWRVPLYWFDMTLRLYIVVMYWKLVQVGRASLLRDTGPTHHPFVLQMPMTYSGTRPNTT